MLSVDWGRNDLKDAQAGILNKFLNKILALKQSWWLCQQDSPLTLNPRFRWNTFLPHRRLAVLPVLWYLEQFLKTQCQGDFRIEMETQFRWQYRRSCSDTHLLSSESSLKLLTTNIPAVFYKMMATVHTAILNAHLVKPIICNKL